MLGKQSALEQTRQPGAEITTATEDKRRPLPVEVATEIVSVLHGFMRRSQNEELVRFRPDHSLGHRAVTQRIERK